MELDNVGCAEDGSSLDPAALMSMCARGGDCIVWRAPVRTAALFSAELEAAAALAGLPPESLARLSPGLWLLLPAASEPSGAAARQQLLDWLPAMGGVRLRGELCLAARSSAELIAACSSVRQREGFAPRWSLVYEVHYPAAEHPVIPFTRLHGAPSLIIGLHAALGAGYCDEDMCKSHDADVPGAATLGAAAHAASAPVDAFVLLQCKNGLLLLRERTLDREPPEASQIANVSQAARMAVESAPGGPLAGASAEMQVGSASALAARAAPAGAAPSSRETSTTWNLPWWVAPWSDRGFGFSASLDPLIGVGALNLAACAHRARLARASGGAQPLAGLSVYDPCVGSGTILAAALAGGAAAAAGSDMRGEFVEGTLANLRELGVLGEGPSEHIVVFEHDATVPLPQTTMASLPAPALVVSNPPWGKKFGKPEDGTPIVRSLISQFPEATFVWLVNKATRQSLESSEQVRIQKVIKLGGVEAVLMHA